MAFRANLWRILYKALTISQQSSAKSLSFSNRSLIYNTEITW